MCCHDACGNGFVNFLYDCKNLSDFSVPTTLVTDLKQLSCTFDNNLCGWKANPKVAGDPIFTRVKPVVNKNLGPATDFNTGSTSGGFFKHAK